jgi:hypothetical protein
VAGRQRKPYRTIAFGVVIVTHRANLKENAGDMKVAGWSQRRPSIYEAQSVLASLALLPGATASGGPTRSPVVMNYS